MVNMHLGGRISAILRERGLTNVWLAEEVDVSSTAVGKWIRTGKISRHKLLEVAKALQLTVDQLIAGQSVEEVRAGYRAGNTPEEQHLINLLREHQIDPGRVSEIIGEMIDMVERKAAGKADAAPAIPTGLPRQPPNLGVGGLTGHVDKPAKQQAPGKLPRSKGIGR